MEKNIYILSILFILISCKNKEQSTDIEPINIQEKTSIKKVIVDFQSKLKDTDTLILDFNLAMEQYIRVDTIFLIKKQNKVYIRPILYEKIEGIDKEFSTNIPSPKRYNLSNSDSLSLESFFKNNLYRTDKNEAVVYTAKIHYKNDSLTLYTYSLSDKAKFIKWYFKTMKVIYPNEPVYNNNKEVFPSIK